MTTAVGHNVIIGIGTGGGTLAYRSAWMGKKILVLEWEGLLCVKANVEVNAIRLTEQLGSEG